MRSEDQGDKLEAIFIEGHTDNIRYRGGSYSNWDLSAKRAIVTYQYITERNPDLDRLINLQRNPLFSVSGYAYRRPLVQHSEEQEDERNRRIDIRFIMTPPAEEAEVLTKIHEQGVN